MRFVDEPAMMPEYVTVAPELTSIVPCDAPRVIPRFVLNVSVAVACRVPPLSVIEVAEADTGAAPRLRSVAIDRIPPVTDTPPSLVLVAERMSVPAPDFVMAPDPETIPEIVADCPDATCTVAADDSATVPVTVPPAVKFSAPADDTPDPARLRGSPIVYAPTCRVAPLDTEVLPPVPPSAEVLPTTKVPALTVVAPV